MGDAYFQHANVGGTNWVTGLRLIPVLRRLGAAETGVVADIGCGSSPYRLYFAKASAYVRIDQRADDAEVIVADAAALPLEAGSVDTILLFQVLGDIADLTAGLEEFRRVLAPGGRILVYETMAYPEHDAPHDYWRVMPQGLRWAADRAGMNIESLDYLGGVFTRFSVLLNSQVLGKLSRFAAARPLVWLLTVAFNLFFAALDQMGRPSVAANDYLACLRKVM